MYEQAARSSPYANHWPLRTFTFFYFLITYVDTIQLMSNSDAAVAQPNINGGLGFGPISSGCLRISLPLRIPFHVQHFTELTYLLRFAGYFFLLRPPRSVLFKSTSLSLFISPLLRFSSSAQYLFCKMAEFPTVEITVVSSKIEIQDRDT
jgi:hypothetical protein